MSLKKFKEVTIKWFGVCNYYTINYLIYTVGGVWTLRRKYAENSLLLYYAARGLILGLHIWVFMGLTYDGYLVRNNMEKLNYSLSSSVFYIVLLSRTMILIPKKDELEDCFQLLNHNFYLHLSGNPSRNSQIFQNGESQMKKVTIFFYMLVLVAVVSRALCHLLPAERMLMIPYPFDDVEDTPYFEIIFSLQTLGLVHFVTVEIGYEMIIYGFLIRITTHFEILKQNIIELEEIFEDEVSGSEIMKSIGRVENIRKTYSVNLDGYYIHSKWRKKITPKILKNLIIHHQQILSFTRRINKLIETPLLIQIFGAGLLLAILLVDVIWQSRKLSARIIGESIYAGTVLADISVLCFYGSEVEEKSHQAGDALYASPWMQMDPDTRKTAALFMMSLWKHPVLRAGGVIPVTLNAYIKFLNLIYNNMAFMENSVRRRGE